MFVFFLLRRRLLVLYFLLLSLSCFTAGAAKISELIVEQNNDRIDVSWQSDGEFRRFNVYLADQQGVLPSGFIQRKLSLRSTKVSFEGLVADKNYFVMVSGISGAGEGGFTEELFSGDLNLSFSPVIIELKEDAEASIFLFSDLLDHRVSLSIESDEEFASEHGELKVVEGGFSYKPLSDFNGLDEFGLRLKDEFGRSGELLVKVNIEAQADPLKLQAASFELNEDENFSLAPPGLFDFVSSPDQVDDEVLFTIIEIHSDDAEKGKLDIFSDGSLTFQPAMNINGELKFSYQVSDTQGDIYKQELTFVIKAQDDGPSAVADEFSVAEDGEATISPLNNDFHADALSFNLTQASAEKGTVLIDGEQILYNPPTDFNGDDIITYVIVDEAGNNASAKIVVTISPIDDFPSIEGEAPSLVNDGDSYNFAPIVKDSDSSLDTLSFSIENLPSWANFNMSSGLLSGSPVSNDQGTYDDIIISVSDPQGNTSSLPAFSITVNSTNNIPSAIDDVATTDEFSEIIIDVLSNDSDLDGDVLNVINASVNVGSVSINSQQALVYQPLEGSLGEVVIAYEITDNKGGSAQAKAIVTVTALAAVGEVDVNNDGQSDVSTGFDEQKNEWKVEIASHVDAVYTTVPQFDNAQSAALSGREMAAVEGDVQFYAVLPDDDGVYRIIISQWQDDDVFAYQIVMNGKRHEYEIAQLNEPEPVAKVDKQGEEIPQVLNESKQVPSQLLEIDSSGLGALNVLRDQGAALYLNQDGSAEYSRSQRSYQATWSLDTDGLLSVIMQGSSQESMMEPVDALVAQGLITQAQADSYISSTNNVEVDVSTRLVRLDLQLIENRQLYWQMDVAVSFEKTVSDFSLSSEPVQHHYISSWYDVDVLTPRVLTKSSIFSGESSTKQILPAPMFDAGQIKGIENKELIFNDDLTGSMDEGNIDFTWLINDKGEIEFISAASQWTSSSIYQSKGFELVRTEAINSLNEHFSSVFYTISSEGPSSGEIVNFVQQQRLISPMPTALALGTSLGGVDSSTVTLSDMNNLPTSEYHFTNLGLAQSNFNSMMNDGIYEPRYHQLDFSDSDSGFIKIWSRLIVDGFAQFVICDPSNNIFCKNFSKQIWRVVKLDDVNKRIWVWQWHEQVSEHLALGENDLPLFSLSSEPRLVYYQVSDNADTVIYPDIPQARSDQYLSTENAFISMPVLDNDISSDGSSLAIVKLKSSHDTAFVDASNQLINWQPEPDFTGVVDLQYLLTNGQNAYDIGSVRLLVNSADDELLEEDSSFTFDVLSLLESPHSFDINLAQSSAMNGQLASQFDEQLGRPVLIYTPAPNYHGPDQIAYRLDDGVSVVDNVINVFVQAQNDAPIANEDSVTVLEGSGVLVDVLSNDLDIDNAHTDLQVQIDQQPAHGSVLKNMDGTINYIHDGSESVADSFSYHINDSHLDSNEVEVIVNIMPSNDEPIITSVALLSVNEDELYSYTLTAVDDDGDNLTISVNNLPAWLSFTQLTNGSASLTGTPSDSDNGGYFIELIVADQETQAMQAFNINVQAVNDPPVANDDIASLDEEGQFDLALSANDLDIDNPPSDWLLTIVTPPTNGSIVDLGGGLWRYSHNGSETNTDTFTYQLNDGQLDSNLATVNLTILAINDEPIIESSPLASVDEGSNYSYLLTASDADGDSLVITPMIMPSWLNLVDNGNGTASISGLPLATDVGSHNVSLSVSDGVMAVSQNYNLTVNDINMPPTAIMLSTHTIDENLDTTSALTILTLSSMDSDIGDSFTYSVSGPDAVTFNIMDDALVVPASTVFDFEVKPFYDINITSTDFSGASFTQNFTINVNDLNDLPTNISIDNDSVNEDLNTTANTNIGVLSTIDQDSMDSFSYVISGGVDSALFSISGDILILLAGSNLDFESKVSLQVQVQVTDAAGASADELLIININDINEAPTSIGLSNNIVDENIDTNSIPLVGSLTTTDVDVDDTFTYSILAGLDEAYFQIIGDNLRFVPGTLVDFEVKANYSINVMTTDSAGLTHSQSLSINVQDKFNTLELDASFADSGEAIFNPFATDNDFVVVKALPLSDGKYIIVANDISNISFATARLNSDGSIDMSYGDDGRLLYSSLTDDQTVNNAVLDASDNLYLAGEESNGSSTYAFVAKLDASGNLDTSFAGDGKYEDSNIFASAHDLLLHSDGSIYFIGEVMISVDYDILLVQLSAVADNVLATQTYGLTDGLNDIAKTISELSDGRLFISGEVSQTANQEFFAMIVDPADISSGLPVEFSFYDLGQIFGSSTADWNNYLIGSTTYATDKFYLFGASNFLNGDNSEAAILAVDVSTGTLSLDAGLGINGGVIFDIDGDSNIASELIELKVNSIGHINIFNFDNSNYRLSQLLVDGSINASFSQQVLPTSTAYPQSATLTIDESDDIIAFYSYIDGGEASKIKRFDNLGIIDTSFDNIVNYQGGNAELGEFAILYNAANIGEIAISSLGSNIHSSLSLLDNTGFIENGFALAGHQTNYGGLSCDLRSLAIAEASDGDLLEFFTDSCGTEIELHRIDLNNSGNGYIVAYGFSAGLPASFTMEDAFYENTNEQVTFAGTAIGASNDVLLVRINVSDASFDLSFNGSGILSWDINSTNSDEQAQKIHVRTDGHIIGSGLTDAIGGEANFEELVFEIDSTGTPELSFNSTGWASYNITGSYALLNTSAILELSDGAYMIASNDSALGEAYLIRITNAGGLDTLFGGTGYKEYRTVLSWPSSLSINSLAVDNYQRIYAAGSVSASADFDDIIMVLWGDGGFDADFNPNDTLGYETYDHDINDGINQIKFDENAKLLLGDRLTSSLSSGTRDDLRIRRMNIVESN